MMRGIKRLLKNIYQDIRLVFFYIFLPINKRKVVFINFNGKGFGDNPKYIALELERLGKDLDMVWLVKDLSCDMPRCIRKVEWKSIEAERELATAKIVVTNVKNRLPWKKKRGQKLIQTWHGSFSPKYVEAEATAQLMVNYPEYIQESKKNSAMTDLFLSNSRLQTEEYRRAFWCTCEIMEKGYPRNDFLINVTNEQKEAIRRKIGVAVDEYLVLYAPTFRDDNSTLCYDIPVQDVVRVFRNRFNTNNVTILVRMHPNIKTYKTLFSWKDNVIDATAYDDVQELLVVSDALITDYSTTMFDFSVQKEKKPVFLYANDIAEYSKMRGLKSEYFKLPFDLSENAEDLIESIETFDMESYSNKLKAYMDEQHFCDDGNAAKAVCEWIHMAMT